MNDQGLVMQTSSVDISSLRASMQLGLQAADCAVDLQVQNGRLKEDLERAKAELELFKTDTNLRGSASSPSSVNCQCPELKEQVSRKEREIAKFKDVAYTLKAQKSDAERRCESLKEVYQNTISELNQTILDNLEKIQSKEADLQMKEAALSAKDDELGDLETENFSLKAKFANYTRKLEEDRTIMERQSKTIEELEVTISKLRVAKPVQGEHSAELEGQVEQLTSRNNKLLAEILDYEKKAMQVEKREAAAKVNHLQKEFEVFRSLALGAKTKTPTRGAHSKQTDTNLEGAHREQEPEDSMAETAAAPTTNGTNIYPLPPHRRAALSSVPMPSISEFILSKFSSAFFDRKTLLEKLGGTVFEYVGIQSPKRQEIDRYINLVLERNPWSPRTLGQSGYVIGAPAGQMTRFCKAGGFPVFVSERDPNALMTRVRGQRWKFRVQYIGNYSASEVDLLTKEEWNIFDDLTKSNLLSYFPKNDRSEIMVELNLGKRRLPCFRLRFKAFDIPLVTYLLEDPEPDQSTPQTALKRIRQEDEDVDVEGEMGPPSNPDQDWSPGSRKSGRPRKVSRRSDVPGATSHNPDFSAPSAFTLNSLPNVNPTNPAAPVFPDQAILTPINSSSVST